MRPRPRSSAPVTIQWYFLYPVRDGSTYAGFMHDARFTIPRHIIRLMVELIAPQPTDTICDPGRRRRWLLSEGGFYRRTLSRHPKGSKPLDGKHGLLA